MFNKNKKHIEVLAALRHATGSLSYKGYSDERVRRQCAETQAVFFVERAAGIANRYQQIQAAQSTPLNDFGAWCDIMFGSQRDPSITNGYIFLAADNRADAAGGAHPGAGISMVVPAVPNGLGKCKWWDVYGISRYGTVVLNKVLSYFKITQLAGSMEPVLWHHSTDGYFAKIGGNPTAEGRVGNRLLNMIKYIGAVDPDPIALRTSGVRHLARLGPLEIA